MLRKDFIYKCLDRQSHIFCAEKCNSVHIACRKDTFYSTLFGSS